MIITCLRRKSRPFPNTTRHVLTLHRPLLFRLAATEEYFGTIQDACRP
ncbi:MAG: hypothetical protein ACREKK_00850 [Candidatus Methylomirabilales bacterium]